MVNPFLLEFEYSARFVPRSRLPDILIAVWHVSLLIKEIGHI